MKVRSAARITPFQPSERPTPVHPVIGCKWAVHVDDVPEVDVRINPLTPTEAYALHVYAPTTIESLLLWYTAGASRLIGLFLPRTHSEESA